MAKRHVGHMSIVYDILGPVENSAKLGHFCCSYCSFCKGKEDFNFSLMIPINGFRGR